MTDSSNRKLIANAQFERDHEYFKNLHRELGKRQLSWKALYGVAIVFNIWMLVMVLDTNNLFYMFIGAGIAAYIGLTRLYVVWKWMRDRKADSQTTPAVEFEFHEKSIVSITERSVSEFDYDSIYKLVVTDQFLLLYPARGIVIGIPTDTISPRSALRVIQEKLGSSVPR